MSREQGSKKAAPQRDSRCFFRLLTRKRRGAWAPRRVRSGDILETANCVAVTKCHTRSYGWEAGIRTRRNAFPVTVDGARLLVSNASFSVGYAPRFRSLPSTRVPVKRPPSWRHSGDGALRPVGGPPIAHLRRHTCGECAWHSQDHLFDPFLIANLINNQRPAPRERNTARAVDQPLRYSLLIRAVAFLIRANSLRTPSPANISAGRARARPADPAGPGARDPRRRRQSSRCRGPGAVRRSLPDSSSRQRGTPRR